MYLTRNMILSVLLVGLAVLGITHLAALTLWTGAFDPTLVLFGGLFLGLGGFLLTRALGCWHFHALGDREGRRHLWDLLFLFLLALAFRFAPLPDFIGGRDDGTYSNLAAHLTHARAASHTDPTLGKPGGNPRALYNRLAGIRELRVSDQVSPEKEDGWEGGFLPGLYIQDADSGKLVFQFPAVHPAWMAISARLFGLSRMNLSVTFFGILTVLGLYLLVLALTAARGAALWAGMLLAVNPLHAYFSRKSLSEPQALFFLILMLLFLTWAWKLGARRRTRLAMIALAVGAYSGYCLTRIDGFFLWPFAVTGAVYLVAVLEDAKARQAVLVTLTGLLVTYLASAWYLKSTTFPYYYSQMEKVFARMLGAGWWSNLNWLGWGVAIGSLALVLLMDRVVGLRRVLRRLAPGLYPVVTLAMGGAIGFHLLKVWMLAQGSAESYVGYVARYGLAGHGWDSVAHSSLVNLGLYLSPPVLGLFFYRLLAFRQGDEPRRIQRTLALVLLAGFLVYGMVLQWVLPYQFYYGRYLLAGLLPLVLLFTLADLAWARKGGRLVTGLLVLAVVWSVGVSATQLRFRGAGAFTEGLGELVKDVDRQDLILWDRSTLDTTPYEMPLIYHSGRKVWTFAGREQLDTLLRMGNVLDDFEDIHVFTTLNYFPNRMARADDIRFRWEEPVHAALLPLKSSSHMLACSRFLVDKSRADGREKIFFNRGKGGVYDLVGFHTGLRWTRGHAELEFNLRGTDFQTLEIRLTGARPGGAEGVGDALRLQLNGVELPLRSAEGQLLIWNLPEEILKSKGNRLVLDTPTFVPAERYPGSRDKRELGLDPLTISFQ